jgi:hypothetical protein
MELLKMLSKPAAWASGWTSAALCFSAATGYWLAGAWESGLLRRFAGGPGKNAACDASHDGVKLHQEERFGCDAATAARSQRHPNDHGLRPFEHGRSDCGGTAYFTSGGVSWERQEKQKTGRNRDR